MEWAVMNRWGVSNAVETCMDHSLIRKVAELIGYKEPEEKKR